jgi:sulfatase maturation enzyme AslB (radical SAM superfamily)
MSPDILTQAVPQEKVIKRDGKNPKEEQKSREWNADKRWNPFNSYKLLAHVERWRHIKRGRPIPAPILITVDPTNVCNLNCVWCNAAYIRKERKGSLSGKILKDIADFLPRWAMDNGVWEPGVKAICVAGGGEPLINPATPEFIDRVTYNGIEVGMVTNGTFINRCVDTLSSATWVGVSVDAAEPATYNKLKNLPGGSAVFTTVIDNIQMLTDYANRHNNKLGWKHPAYGVSYKYLLYKDNIGQIFDAAKLAKRIGCKNIHFRPAATTWNNIHSDKEVVFTKDDIALFKDQISRALELDDGTFGVYGVTHKFNSQFEKVNCFKKCYAIFMTAVIMPSSDADAGGDVFTLGLCCDRRGDHKLELGKNLSDVNVINSLWGSDEHWKISDDIRISHQCPRCTYQPHNEIYEQVILNDSMTHKFI